MVKNVCVMVMAALLAVHGVAAVSNLYFRGTTGDRVSWNQLGNWQEYSSSWINPTALPDNDDNVWIGYFQADPGMVIGNGVTAYAGVLYGSGGQAQAKNYDLTIAAGGKLEVKSTFYINTHRNNNPVGVVTVQSGGELTLTDGASLLIVAWGGAGAGSEVGTGTLVVDGGVVNARTIHVSTSTNAIGHIQLNAGTINLYGHTTNGWLGMTGQAGITGTNSFDITGGTLNLYGSQQQTFSLVQQYIANGTLTGYGNPSNVRYSYDGTKTIVTASPSLAINPSPQDQATISRSEAENLVLTWEKGQIGNFHDVYFGDSLNAVTAATTSSPEYKGRLADQPVNVFDPEPLQVGKTYYWRVDELDSNPPTQILAGQVWSFTVHGDGVSAIELHCSPEYGAVFVYGLCDPGSTLQTARVVQSGRDVTSFLTVDGDGVISGVIAPFFNETEMAVFVSVLDPQEQSFHSISNTLKLIRGDLNCDSAVNLSDIAVLADNWMVPPQSSPEGFEHLTGDLNATQSVDLGDFEVLASQWLVTQPPHTPSPIWDLQTLFNTPRFRWLNQTGTVRSLLYEGQPYQNKPVTDVFAYYATPGTLAGNPALDVNLPGIVLVHGGGGTAYQEWVILWAQRGYAAIAMDLYGKSPDGQKLENGGPSVYDDGTNAFNAFTGIDRPMIDQWPYHAVSNVVLAHSLLRAMPGVDVNRVAVTGISWGGFLTCITAGVDSRFAAAVPVYGCGYIYENSTWLSSFALLTPTQRTKWIQWYDPSSHIGAAQMPILFVNGTNDFAYPIDSWFKTSLLPQTTPQYRLTVNMPHNHPDGWSPQEIYLFIDHYFRGGVPLPVLTSETYQNGQLAAVVQTQTQLTSATLRYTTDTGPINQRQWQNVTAAIVGNNISVAVPPTATVWFLNVLDQRNAIISGKVHFAQ